MYLEKNLSIVILLTILIYKLLLTFIRTTQILRTLTTHHVQKTSIEYLEDSQRIFYVLWMSSR